MKTKLFIYLAWSATALVMCLWVVFFWFVWKLEQERGAYALSQATLAQIEEEVNAASRLHGIVRNSKQGLAALDALAKTDVLTAVDIIEKIGTAAGVKVHVEGASATSLLNNKPSKDIHAFLITVTSEGKLQLMMRLISFLDALPLATSLAGVELQQISQDPQGKSVPDLWRLTARIRIITTSPIGA